MILEPMEWLQINKVFAPFIIVGGGAAGITLALELEKQGLESIIIEAGGEKYSAESQDIYKGTMTGGYELPNGLTGLRQRYFGGSTNCWAGGCTEFNEEDFLVRPWINDSGWPFSKSELSPYYERAAKHLEVNIEKIRFPEKKGGLPKFSFFETNSLEYCKNVRFLSEFGQKIRSSKLINVYLNANLTEIFSIDQNISSVEISDYFGNKQIVHGRFFTLACGGIENARILLNSNRNGNYAIGNRRGNVGRYFSEHPIGPCGTVYNKEGLVSESPWEATQFINKMHYPYYRCPYKIQEKLEILNFTIQFHFQEDQFTKADIAALKLYKKIKGHSQKSLTFKEWSLIASNPIDVGKTLYEKTFKAQSRLALRFQLEQSPNRESKITLSDDKDQFGKNRVNLSWNFTDLEKKTIEASIALTSKALWLEKHGTIKVDNQILDEVNAMPGDLRGGGHHCGTTRMASDPSKGVVDSTLKVYETNNLFIAGSSVFPTNSWANPTFTIIALTIRLADHLKTLNKRPV